MSMRLDECGNAVTEPFTNLQGVLGWTPSTLLWESAAINKAPAHFVGSDLQGQTRTKPSSPQVLVCHDLRGGYLEDRFIHGCSASSAYTFYHWQLIDIFIYFSHNFVTIPPVGWIHAAKKHGVTVLGTIITEWDEGAEICKELLKSEETIDQLTTKLAQMALLHGFHGWLVNIENKIESDQVPRLRTFVQQLTAKCHHLLDVSKVLWYDSVISTGELKWQDELNSLNEMFFTVADGIFLNYNTTAEKLAKSKQLSSVCGRELDVYAGIDIFGRSPPAYGGYSTIETLKMIRDQGLSCALFAPGWAYEQFGPEQFHSNELMFWGILSEVLSPRPVEIPFATSFCRGYGDRFYVQGQAVTDGPWYNLSLQQMQPSFTHSQFVAYTVNTIKTLAAPGENQQQKEKQIFTFQVETRDRHPDCPEMMYDLSVGYVGGGSLRLAAGRSTSMFRMLTLKAAQEKSVCVSVTWRLPPETSGHAGVALSAGSAGWHNGGPMVVCLDTVLSDVHRDLVDKALQESEGLPAPVHYLTGAKHEIICKDGNWTRWNFDVDLSLLLRADSQELILSVILIPSLEVCNGVKSAAQMCIHIGHLQVVGAAEAQQLTEDSCIRNLKHLTAQVSTPVSRQVIDQIVGHPFFATDLELPINMRATPENKSQLTGAADKQQVEVDSETQHNRLEKRDSETQHNCLEKRDSETQHNRLEKRDSETQYNRLEKRDLFSKSGSVSGSLWRHTIDLSSEAPADMLHVIQWEKLTSNVHVYLVYVHDEDGIKQCIGQTAENWFVWKQTGADKQVTKFSVKPVLKNCSQFEEVFVCV